MSHTSIALQPTWPPASSTPAFPYDCLSDANRTSALLSKIIQPSDNTPTFPPWITALCPEVVSHFTAFPYFSVLDKTVPVMTSFIAAHLVCTVKLIRSISSESQADVMLYAGSLIGALRHGGPVPWDDDMDVAMPFIARDAFMKRCQALKNSFHPDIAITCQRQASFIKVFLDDRCAAANRTCYNGLLSQNTPHPWKWPFVDVFLYKANTTVWSQVLTNGDVPFGYKVGALSASFFRPVRHYYFGGLVLPGPRPAYADTMFNWHMCETGHYSHQREAFLSRKMQRIRLNCCEAARFVPFVVDGGVRRLVGNNGVGIDIDRD